MNNLDDLIRSSLNKHTPATAPDGGLAGRAKAVGRRVRMVQAGGVALLAVVLSVGVIWGVTTLPGRSQSIVAASPQPGPASTSVAPSESAGSSPSATAVRPSTSADGKVRDVSKLGAPADGQEGEMLVNYFASPTGNFHCFISTVGAGCTGQDWDAGVEPSRAVCKGSEGGVMGPEIWGTANAAWECGTDPHSFPFFYDSENPDESPVAWWDESFGESAPWSVDPTQTLAILPYGKTLVAGDFSCTMAKAGVSCHNSATGSGFKASRAKVELNS